MSNIARFRGPWIPLFGIVLVASLIMSMSTSQFFTAANGYVILSNAALLSVIGFSQLVVLAVGQFSLAIAGIGNLTGVILGFLLVDQGVPLFVAVAAGIVAGALCGLVNGVIITRTGVDAFIVTLATGGAFAGIALGITQTIPYTGLPEIFTTFGSGRWGFIPFLLVATIVVAVLLGVLYRWAPAGRSMLAVGGNAEAAGLSGVSANRSITYAHTLSGALAGVAGIMAAAQLHQANPLVASDWLIQSLTVAIVGGTLLTGGSISIAGVLVAGLILAIISDALILLRVDAYWVTLIQGALVFVAVMIGRSSAWSAFQNATRILQRRGKVAQ
jgi:ribose transport system permease protein